MSQVRMRRRALGWTCGALLLAGCAHRVWNEPIGALAPEERFEFANRLPDNSEEVFVVLAFSGGGTRAASFSYGVLEALRDTEVMIDGKPRRLLDEVDVISSVSGGSYTAAYYGLFGDRTFARYREDFLTRDWQGELLRLADYLGRTLFEGRRFDDLSRDGRPFVIINASDLNNATTFSFIQQHFDFLCSDLSDYPVSHAVMASSALPGPFTTTALRNHPDCPQRHPGWVAQSLAKDPVLARRRVVAMALARYQDPTSMPILRLVDGGVTDNLGVRGSMMSPVAHYGNVPDMAGAFSPAQLRKVRHVLVVVANAEVYTPTRWSLDGDEPGLVATTRASFDASLGILNSETAELARQGFLMWGDQINAGRATDQAPVKVRFSLLTFHQIADDARRAKFNAMPTTFRLQASEVDELVDEAGRLLRASPEFRAFLDDLSEAAPAPR
jgi:NTE family protein